MATDCIAQVAFRFRRNAKPVITAFDMAHASSDGGALLLKALDERVATCLTDPRRPGKVQYELIELLRQRVFGLACGYADCNDAGTSCWIFHRAPDRFLSRSFLGSARVLRPLMLVRQLRRCPAM